MNKIVSTKKTSAIFLAIVLVVGVFAISSPLTVYGQQYEQDYESAYYPSHPGMAEDNQHVKIQKANCDNDNVNVNDLSQVQRQEQTLRSGGFNPDAGDAPLSGQDLTPDEAFAAINGNGDPLITAERNILNVCFNDNDNELSGDFTGTQTQTEPTITCEECFEESIPPEALAILITSLEGGITIIVDGEEIPINSLAQLCAALQDATLLEAQNFFIRELNGFLALSLLVCLDDVFDFENPDIL